MLRYHVYLDREKSEQKALEQELDFSNRLIPLSVITDLLYKRTTVSIPEILADLLSIKLGKTPRTRDAHRAVSKWLQGKIDTQKAPHTEKLSKWLQSEATLFIADKQITRYYEKQDNT